jgi:hypothetical protein
MPLDAKRSRPEAASATFLAIASFLLFLFILPVRELSAADAPDSGRADTLSIANTGADSASGQAAKSRTDSLIVVKHSFEHREQIITGSVVMTCLMLMMVAMNNYNPR